MYDFRGYKGQSQLLQHNIEKLPGNNFKKGAELEIKKVIEIADQMKIDRDDEISLKFYAC